MLATEPDDYTAITDMELTFTADDVINTALCVNVTIVDDSIVEPEQSFTVSLTSNDPVQFVPVQQANVVIMDNDSK